MAYSIISKIDRVAPIEGADRIQVGFVRHNMIVISKETQPGTVGIFFIGGSQLSHDYCRNNNLYRDKTLNSDQTKSGYFENTRRVRTQTFRGVKSEGLFMPISSLSYLGKEEKDFKLGQIVDTINKNVICEKYISEKTKKLLRSKSKANRKKQKVKKEYPFFFEHQDTSQFLMFIDTIPQNAQITISHKMHGTSGRYGMQLVNTKLDKFLSKFKLYRNKFEPVIGTRRVVKSNIKDISSGFYKDDEAFRYNVYKELEPFLTQHKGLTIYCEIVGYTTSGSPIMAKQNTSNLKSIKGFREKYGNEIFYSYGNGPSQCSFFVYRITETTQNGDQIDWSHSKAKDWCEQRGINFVTTFKQFIYDGDQENLISLVKKYGENEDNMYEDYLDPRHLLEGVVIRVDHNQSSPKFFKYKNFPFKVLEGIAQDEFCDIEDAESVS